MNVHRSTIHNSQKLETSQMSISGWINKQNVVYSYSGVSVSLKQEGNPDRSYSVEEPGRQYAEWSKPNTKGQTVYETPRIEQSRVDVTRSCTGRGCWVLAWWMLSSGSGDSSSGDGRLGWSQQCKWVHRTELYTRRQVKMVGFMSILPQ